MFNRDLHNGHSPDAGQVSTIPGRLLWHLLLAEQQIQAQDDDAALDTLRDAISLIPEMRPEDFGVAA